MTPAAFSGNYADIKTVKTRGVFQVIVEIKIEDYQKFVAAFGGPLPGSERPVALALLKPTLVQDNDDRPRVPWTKMPRAQRAGILCNDTRFQVWATDRAQVEINPEKWPGDPKESAAMYIRWRCGVKSRAELDNTDEIALRFDLMDSLYRQETGQLAEVRG
jgi:hypothetical protein